MKTCLEDPTKFQYTSMIEQVAGLPGPAKFDSIRLIFNGRYYRGSLIRRDAAGIAYCRYFSGPLTEASLKRLQNLCCHQILVHATPQNLGSCPSIYPDFTGFTLVANMESLAFWQKYYREKAEEEARQAAQKAWEEALAAEDQIEAEQEEYDDRSTPAEQEDGQRADQRDLDFILEQAREPIPFPDLETQEWEEEESAIAAAESEAEEAARDRAEWEQSQRENDDGPNGFYG